MESRLKIDAEKIADTKDFVYLRFSDKLNCLKTWHVA